MQENVKLSTTRNTRDNSRINSALKHARKHTPYRTTVREPSTTFFQQALIVEGITIGVIFAILNVVIMLRDELYTVTYAGCDRTFKTTPCIPKLFRRGSLVTF